MINHIEIKVNALDNNKTGDQYSYSPRGFVEDVINYPWLANLTDDEKEKLLSGFARYIAFIMRRMLKDSIRDQRYKGYWTPLDEKYLQFKKDHGLSQNIWESTGFLLDNISAYRQGSDYIVGFRPFVCYPGTDVKVLYVAQCLEFGTEHMPARPLFGPVTRHIRRYIRRYWLLYLMHPKKYIGDRLTNKIWRERGYNFL